MKLSISLTMLFFILSCNRAKNDSVELIKESNTQKDLFMGLVKVVHRAIPEISLDDSLSFLILPIQASCPGCRKKTIDSIVKHQYTLPDKHYIIISANGGKKTIRSYFLEQQYQIPSIPGKLILDSSNIAYKNNLYLDKPTIYYTYRRKTYKKVSAIPSTVRDDLREFFSGYRN